MPHTYNTETYEKNGKYSFVLFLAHGHVTAVHACNCLFKAKTRPLTDRDALKGMVSLEQSGVRIASRRCAEKPPS